MLPQRPGGLPRPTQTQLTAVAAAALALLAAVWSVCTITLLPPHLTPRHLQVGAAAVDLMVDAPQSWVLDARKAPIDLAVLAQEADLAGNVISTAPVRRAIAHEAGIPARQLSARTRLTGDLVAVLREPDNEQRAAQIAAARLPYGIDVQVDPQRPLLHVYTRAPTAVEAMRLADAVPAGLTRVAAALPAPPTAGADRLLHVVPLGPARGAVVNSRSSIEIALITLLVVFGVAWPALLLLLRARAGWRAAAGEPAWLWSQQPHPVAPVVATADDWPRTTRRLPWMVAAFLALLWLVPFNTIQLHASLPFDLKLDRIVLPVLVGAWIATVVAGRRDTRPFVTSVHIAVGVFLAAAFLSLVVNAHELNHNLEFPLAMKKMVLLGSYGCFFLLVASVVRRSEVPAFLRLTLGLAVLCALGSVWEYRTHSNLFYSLSSGLLPHGLFTAAPLDSGQVDEIGRRLTRGPAEHPLELTAMVSMALPIALVGLLRNEGRTRRRSILYAVAACLLFAAALSTYRKSALLAPLSVGATLAYFRRAELMRLAPLGAVAAAVVHVLSPGAFGSIAAQIRPDRLGVGTVTDRTSDYDALRPDLWTHLFLGRGFGSYDHVSYRILDSEILGLLAGVGTVGLGCYLAMLATIVLAARRPARSPDAATSDAALAVAAAAVVFGVVSFLFDAVEFPHGPYILLSLAGLLAVLLGPPDRASGGTTRGRARQPGRGGTADHHDEQTGDVASRVAVYAHVRG